VDRFTLAGMAAWLAPERGKTSRVPDDERSSLESWLEFHRATLLVKCAGLTPEQLVTRSCPPSPLYARHNGHADLLRERIDGATGS
jgi:Protein of unknown function (DUF664)